VTLIAHQTPQAETVQRGDPLRYPPGLFRRADTAAVHAGIHFHQDTDLAAGGPSRRHQLLGVCRVVYSDHDPHFARRLRQQTAFFRPDDLVGDKGIIEAGVAFLCVR